MEAFAVTGDAKQCVRIVRRFFDAGLDELLINVGASDTERRAAFDLITAINR